MNSEPTKRDGKLQTDIAWNVGSLAILGLAGIGLNTIVICFYDAAVLGTFNQVFALYFVFSQFAVGGIHLSVLKHAAEHPDDPVRVREIVCSSLVPTTVLAGMFTAVFVLARKPLAEMLQSPEVAMGVLVAAPGLFLFSLNKVLMAVLNAERRMKHFAFFQAFRPISFIASAVVLAGTGQAGALLPFMFTVAEGLVLVGLVIALFPRLRGFVGVVSKRWVIEHMRFGGKAYLSGVLAGLNTRLDVLMLGWFMSDKVVGIYSFAAIIAEGFFQLTVIVRNNFNPILVRLLADTKQADLITFVKRGRNKTWLWMGAIGAASVALYPLAAKLVILFGAQSDLAGSWSVFAIIAAGVVLSAGYLPFMNLLVVAGRPASHTVLIFAGVVFNVAANCFLIPVWGANGAAVALGAAYVFSVLLLRVMTRRLLGVRI